MEKVNGVEETVHSTDLPPKTPDSGGLINASGHRQELDRNFSLINICGLGVTTGNTWIALGGSIVCKFDSSVSWEVSLMAFRLSQSTMEDRQVLCTNCMFATLISVLSADKIQHRCMCLLLAYRSFDRGTCFGDALLWWRFV